MTFKNDVIPPPSRTSSVSLNWLQSFSTSFKNRKYFRVWQRMPAISALGRHRQEDGGFQASVGIVRLCLKDSLASPANWKGI